MIKPNAQLPANYESREMRLCLTKNGKKWAFCMRDAQGYCVGLHAFPPHGASHWAGFKRRKDAINFAIKARFPAFAIWNGITKTYDAFDQLTGESVFVVHARNKGAVSWKGESV